MKDFSIGFVTCTNSKNYNDVGGARTYTLELIRALNKFKINARIIGNHLNVPYVNFIYYNATLFLNFDKFRDKYSLDIIHSQASDGFLLHNKKIPFVLTIHSPPLDEINMTYDKTKNKFLKESFFSKIDKFNSENADLIIAVSKYSKKKISEYYKIDNDKIVVIYNGVDLTLFNGIPKNTKKSEYFDILFVGKLYKRKGLIFLIQSMEKLIEKYSFFRLIIIGDGPEHFFLQNYVKKKNLQKNIVFLGQVNHFTLLQNYLICDLFCLPSLQEGFGIVLTEAMLAKKPVISTTAGSIPEIVKNNSNGILVSPKNPNALSDAIEKLYLDENLRQKFGTKGYQDVMKKFSWEKSAKAYIDVYEKVMY